MGSPSQGLTRPGHFGTMPDNPEIWKAVAMADHFEKIQKLPDPIPGVPNFRRVPGYKVYCCGQPTAAALETTLNKVCGEIYPKDKKIIWFNMRQEPTVYIKQLEVRGGGPDREEGNHLGPLRDPWPMHLGPKGCREGLKIWSIQPKLWPLQNLRRLHGSPRI